MSRHYKLFLEDYDAENIDILKAILLWSKTKAVIFCNSSGIIDWLIENLHLSSIPPIVSYYGALSNTEKQHSLKAHFDGSSIITTDIMAKNCPCCELVEADLVINFEVPRNQEIYKHRASRATSFMRGKWIKPGVIINILDKHEDFDYISDWCDDYRKCPTFQQLAVMF